MGYTLGQAAKATGRGKATIAKAIASNRISATKNEEGAYDIDPAELHRVYAPKGQPRTAIEHQGDTGQTAEVERLKATVEGLERLLSERDRVCCQLECERDSLREQNIRLTALLPPPQPAAAPKARRWWQRRVA